MSTVSDFSSDSFDVSQWINTALDECTAEDGLESYLASLAMKLHVVSQEYNDQLESSMLEAMSTMPGVQNEISRIEDSIAAMNVEMQDLAQQIQTFDEHNVAGVEELSRLDILKRNMEFCKNTLEEHARWNQLVREAKTFLEGGGRLADSADRISIMYRSLDVLKGMPQHEEREETYKSLRDTLLSAVHPRMVAAIAVEKIDMSTILEYNYVYDKLSCKEKLEMEYINARPERLKAAWKQYDGSSSESTAFLTFYEDFLSQVLALLNKEKENLALLTNRSRLSSSSTAEILISISELLCTMLTSTLDNTIKRDLTRHLKDSLADGSSAKAYKLTNEFAVQCLKCLLFDEHGDVGETDRHSGGTSGRGGDAIENPAEEAVADRILSLRSLIVDNQQSPDSERVIAIVLKALSSIYSPLASDLSTLYASDGATLRSKLSDSISSIQLLETDNMDTGSGIMGMSQQSQSSASNFEDATGLGLEQSDFVDSSGSALDPSQSCTLFAEKMVTAVESIHEPIEQCLISSGVLTGGLYMKSGVTVVSQSVATSIKALLSKLDELRIASRLNTTAGSTTSDYGMRTPNTKTPGTIAPTPSSVAESWARKLEMHDNSSRTLLPAALRVLQAAGRLRKKMVIIDTMSIDLCAKISAGLYNIESEEDFIQKLLLSCDEASPATTIAGTDTSTNTNAKTVADIGLVYASYVIYRSNDKDMQKFLTSTTTSRISEPVASMLEKLKTKSGCYFFDLCTAIPERMLVTLHEEAVWSDKSKMPRRPVEAAVIKGEEGSVHTSDLVIDEELLPQYALSQCGEHLLSLVQEMELFSSSDALSDLVHLQGEAANIVTSCNGWNDKMATSLMAIIKKAGSSLLVDVSKTDAATAKGVERPSSPGVTKIVAGKEVNVSSQPEDVIDGKVVQEGITQLCLRSSCLATIHLSEKLMFGQVVSKFEFDEAENVNDSDNKTGETSNTSLPTTNMVVDMDSNNNEASATLFVNEWLEGVSDAVTGLLLMEITKIQTLSYHGRAQLAVDLDYMHNVVNAMGLRVHPLLIHLRSVIAQPPETLLDAVQQIPSRTPAGIVLKVVDRCVAKAMIRGSD